MPLTPSDIFGDLLQITQSSFIMDTLQGGSISLVTSAEIEMWWGEKWQMDLEAHYDSPDWSITFAWPNSATFSVWVVDLMVPK